MDLKKDQRALAHECFKTTTRFAGQEFFGLRIIDDLLGLWIPSDFATESSSDSCQMARRQSSVVAMHIGDRFDAIPSSFEEVSEVVR
jgi:hypothetical protein